MVAMAAALAVYFGFHVFNTFNDPFSTTLTYSYTVNDSVEADGILIRSERVLTGSGGIVDVTQGEGEKVGVGQTVALIHRDSNAQADQAELERLEREILVLQAAVTDSGSVESSAHLDEDILQSVVSLRAAAALNDYNDLEDQVMELKSAVLKRGYTYGGDLSAADLSARLKELTARYNELSRSTASSTVRVRANRSGTFSALVDGKEDTLTPDAALTFTPSTLEEVLDAKTEPAADAIGKLITADRWYFAVVLEKETADRLKKGGSATLRFSGDFEQDVEMRVDHISAAENGTVAVVFSTDRYLNRTTLLRRQTAELIFDTWSGLRLPKEAVHMVKTSRVDEKTGETVETTRLGVYVLMGGRAEFKGVEVVTEGSDYYVVRPTSAGSDALRAGDEVITRAVGLYDGQLLEF